MSTSAWRQAAAFGGFGLLAAVTAWWAHRPEVIPEAGAVHLSAPVYSLREATLDETGPDGRWRLRVEADQAREAAPDSREIALEGVKAVYHPGSPRAWRLQAREGRLPAGSHRLLLKGDVRLQPSRADIVVDARIRTSTLTVDLDGERATTPAAVEVYFGRHALTARGLTADMKAGTLRLESALHGTFQR